MHGGGKKELTVIPEVIAPIRPATTGSDRAHILRPTYAPHNPATKYTEETVAAVLRTILITCGAREKPKNRQ